VKSKSIEEKKEFKKLVKCCHMCTQVFESPQELERCPKCNKSFLPLNYFDKIHSNPDIKITELYAGSHELNDEDLIIGIHVLW
jgi:Zn finger protein HypA/HybF involved in hydrogenase expression